MNFSERWVFISKGKTKSARRKVPLTKRADKILRDVKAGLQWVPNPDGAEPSHSIAVPDKPHVFLLRGRDRMTTAVEVYE